MRAAIFIIFISVTTSGCAVVRNADELLTLKAVGDEQSYFDEVVEEHDARFRSLVKAVHDGSIDQYPDKKSIYGDFGAPINVNTKLIAGQEQEFWYYRRSVKFFDSDEVYLYFDNQGKLLNWEYSKAKEQ